MASPVWHFVNGVPTGGVWRPSVTLAGDGFAAAPSYSFASDPDTGLYSVGADSIGMATAGTLRHEFTSGGHYIYSDSGAILFGTSRDVSLSRGAADVLTTPDRFVSTGPVAGIGYGTGAGGVVTQLTSKATGVTLNTVTGNVTMNGAALAAGATVSFTLTSAAIVATDYILVQHISGGTVGAYITQADGANGSAIISVTNRTAGSLSEAIILKFVVFKAVTS